MSRSLLGFLVFCLLLVVATGGVVWYVGPTLAGIVIDEARRESTYYLLQLLPAGAMRAGDDTGSYRGRFVELAGEESGALIWQGGAVEVIDGSVLLDVSGAQLLEFDTGVNLVQMLTSSAYRELESSAGELAVLQVGASQAPDALAPDQATVAVLYESDMPAIRAPLGVPGERGWLALLPRFQGEVRWDTAVAAVRGDAPWNRVLLLQFPSSAAAQNWLMDPVTVTERAIARKQVDGMTVLLIAPSRYLPG